MSSASKPLVPRSARVRLTASVPVNALSEVTVRLMSVPSVTADGSVASCSTGVVSVIVTTTGLMVTSL